MIGLDIQPYGIRLVQIKKIGPHHWVENMAVTKLPSQVFGEGKIKRWDIVCSLLKGLVRRLGVEKSAAAICIPANLVRLQNLQLPAGSSEAAIEKEIHQQLERDLPGLAESLCLDYAVVSENATYSEVLFAVSRNEYVMQYVDCVNAAGLNVKVVEVDSFALLRGVQYGLSAAALSETQAIVFAANDMASLIIFRGADILFQQQWEILHAADFTAQLNQRLQLYHPKFDEKEINRFWVCGARDYFAAQNGAGSFPVDYPNPFMQMKLSSTAAAEISACHASDFLLASGLALREVPKW